MNHTSALLRSLLFNVLSVVVMIALCLVISLGVELNGAESTTTESRVVSSTPAAASTTNAKTATVTPVTPTLDLRDALAISVRERTELREQVAQLQTQKWLMIGCLMVITGVAIRLGMMILSRGLHPAPQVETKPGKNERESDVFPADTQTREITSVTKRKNATITIRNGATQKEEVTGNVETRRFFTKDDDSNSKRIARGATATVARKTSRIEASPSVQETELRPSTDRTEKKESPMEPTKSVTATQSRPKTVRVDHQSDRLDPVDVALKPGTGAIVRQSGFSILEVMISLVILATVLASVCSNIYTLHLARTLAKEESQANDIKRWCAEELMSVSFGNLTNGIYNATFLNRTAQNPIDAVTLKNYLVTSNKVNNTANPLTLNYDAPLSELQIYLEYYPLSDLENAMEDSDGPTGQADQPDLTTLTPNRKRVTLLTNQVTNINNINNNITLNGITYSSNAVVIRIIVQWLSSDGGIRQVYKDITRNKLK